MEKRLETVEKSIGLLRNELGDLKKLVSTGFTKIDGNFSSIQNELKLLNGKYDKLNQKIDDLSSGTDHSFGKVDIKLDSLSDEIKKIADVTRYDEQFNNLNTIERSLKN